MEESIEDMLIRVRGASRFNAELAIEIQRRIDNHVRMATENQSITVTQQNLVDILSFAGISINKDHGFNKEEMEAEYTIESRAKVNLDGREDTYQGLACHCTEYPEEGSIPLNLGLKNNIGKV